MTGLFTVNAGGGGNPRTPNGAGNPGSAGSAPGSTRSFPINYLLDGSAAGGARGTTNPAPNGNPGQQGGAGHLTFYTDGGQ